MTNRTRVPMQYNQTVPLDVLVTEDAAMREVLSSGRVSDTPNDPVWLVAREDMPGRWEIADGHHRVAHAIREGHTVILADLDPVPDEEPYEPPFYDFTRHMAGSLGEVDA